MRDFSQRSSHGADGHRMSVVEMGQEAILPPHGSGQPKCSKQIEFALDLEGENGQLLF